MQIDSAKYVETASFILAGVTVQVVIPYKLPSATNRDVIIRDRQTKITLSPINNHLLPEQQSTLINQKRNW